MQTELEKYFAAKNASRKFWRRVFKTGVRVASRSVVLGILIALLVQVGLLGRKVNLLKDDVAGMRVELDRIKHGGERGERPPVYMP